MEDKYYKYLGNVKILNIDKVTILNEIQYRLMNKIKTRVYFINAHCFNVAQKNNTYLHQINQAEMVLNDGIGVELGAKIFGIHVKENLNGTDFTPDVLRILDNQGQSLYILGGKPGIAEKAASEINKRFSNIQIVGTSDGYFKDSKLIVSKINEAKPDLVLVGLGVPLQENWISTYLEQLDVSVIMAVGAFLDFTSGTVQRAPRLFRKVRMEWLFRLLLEPKRMFGRYVIGNVVFFVNILKLAKQNE